ncbi:hypothetical protein HK102_003730 [Quaeritorhiza haematococci]|nr:hypothetical protein HK102_003730 [Quaeritorhiza haematococci]
MVRPPRQSFIGEVIGTAMMKTAKIRVARTRMHPIVQKPVTFHKNFLAHDETQRCVVGDIVRIDSCDKISKMKNFTVAEIVKPAARYVDPETGNTYTQRQVEDWRKAKTSAYEAVSATAATLAASLKPTTRS